MMSLAIARQVGSVVAGFFLSPVLCLRLSFRWADGAKLVGAPLLGAWVGILLLLIWIAAAALHLLGIPGGGMLFCLAFVPTGIVSLSLPVSGGMHARAPREHILHLDFGGVPLPPAAEPLGVLVVGSPGVGKTQAINGNLSRIRARGERVLMLDAGGEALGGWWQQGDLVLNPHDDRAVAWSPLAEMEGTWDAQSVAAGVTGEPGENESGEWVQYAQDLIATILEKLWDRPGSTNREVLYWLTVAPPAELAELVAGEPVSRFFTSGAERMLSSILGIVGARMKPFRDLDPAAGRDGFSLRRWAADETATAWVWFPYRDDQARALKPLMRSVVECAATALLSQPTALGRRVWFMMDEFASIGRVDKLLDLLAKGRKKGACCVAGLQAIGQLDAIYGRDHRGTIRNTLQTLLALRAADAATGQWLEEDFGKTKYVLEKTSVAENDGGGIFAGQAATTTTSASGEIREESLFLASDFKDLPTLRGILKIVGMPACVVDVDIVNPPHAVPPFVPKRRAPAATAADISAASQANPVPSEPPPPPAPAKPEI